MESWLARGAGLLCALGGWGLLWTFGALLTVPWHEGRLLALSREELQAIGVPIVTAATVLWGSLHIFALIDRKANPRVYLAERVFVLLTGLGAAFAGCSWSLARIA